MSSGTRRDFPEIKRWLLYAVIAAGKGEVA